MALHALTSALVWYGARGAGTIYGTALATAAIFAVHPLHAGVVVADSGQRTLVAATCALVAWLAHRRARRARGGWPIAAAGAWLASLIAWPGAWLAPALFVVEERLAPEPEARRSSRALAVAYSVAFVAALFATRLAGSGTDPSTGLASNLATDLATDPGAAPGMAARLSTSAWALLRGTGLFFWPFGPTASSAPLDSNLGAAVWAGVAGLAVVGLFALLRRSAPPAATGLAAWVLLFVPAAGLANSTGTSIAGPAYLASMGLCLVVGHQIAALARRPGRPDDRGVNVTSDPIRDTNAPS